MDDLSVRSLAGVSAETLCAASNEAFRDYPVSVQMTAGQLTTMMRQNDVDLRVSAGLFDNDARGRQVPEIHVPFQGGVQLAGGWDGAANTGLSGDVVAALWHLSPYPTGLVEIEMTLTSPACQRITSSSSWSLVPIISRRRH